MKVLFQWLVPFIALCSAFETIPIVSKKGLNEVCFPVRLKPRSQGHLDIHYDDYVPLDDFGVQQSVSVAVYRHVDVKNVGTTHNGKFLSLCDADAVKYGYCEQKHLGKIVFTYVDPTTSNGKLVNLVLNEVDVYPETFTFEETGYYCVATYSSSTKSYKLSLEIIDGYEDTLSERNAKFASELTLTVVLATRVFLIFTWLLWSNFWVFKIPFQSKIVVIDGIFNIIKEAVRLYEAYHTEGIFSTEIYQKFKAFFFEILYPLFFLFYLYQFAISFAYRNPKTYYGAPHFISILFISIGYYFIIPEDMLGEVVLKGYTIDEVVSFTIKAAKGLLGFKIFNEVNTTVGAYEDVKRGQEPRVKLFRVWIFFELFNALFQAYGEKALTFFFSELLLEVSDFKEYLFIDNSKFRVFENYDVTMAMNAIQGPLYFMIAYKYLIPSYYEGVLKFHNLVRKD